jgi:hypothetical protein
MLLVAVVCLLHANRLIGGDRDLISCIRSTTHMVCRPNMPRKTTTSTIRTFHIYPMHEQIDHNKQDPDINV